MGKAENSRLNGSRHFLTSVCFSFLHEHNFDLVLLADLSETIFFLCQTQVQHCGVGLLSFCTDCSVTCKRCVIRMGICRRILVFILPTVIFWYLYCTFSGYSTIITKCKSVLKLIVTPFRISYVIPVVSLIVWSCCFIYCHVYFQIPKKFWLQ